MRKSRSAQHARLSWRFFNELSRNRISQVMMGLLQHLHDEALQIARLRHAGEDGMVGALATLLDESDVSLGDEGRCTVLFKLEDPCHAPLDRLASVGVQS